MNARTLKILAARQIPGKLPIISVATLLLLTLFSNNATAQGALVNGALYQGAISTTGQVDSFTFTANAGDSVVLRAGTLTSTNYFDPWLRVYGPDGTLLGSKDPAQGAVAELALTATNSGTYTVLISDGDYTQYQNEGYDGTGTYQLNYVDIPGSFAVTPGDQGGPMTNGAVYTGGISSGDLDAWSFTANAGDSVVVRVGTLTSANYFDPWLRVYGPDGTLLGSKDPAQGAVAELALTATNSGTYTVLISDGDYTQYQNEGYDGTGTYQLNYVDIPGSFAVTPGDQGGPMTNGAVYTGGISSGDLDAWTFTANAGDSVVVRVGTLTSANYFDPWLRVYGPDGTLLGSKDPAQGAVAELALTATNSGTYTVLISDGDYTQYQNEGYDGTGTYQLNYVDIPGSFAVTPGDQGGPMTNGAVYTGGISSGDLDAWTFTANAGDSVVVRVGTLTSANYFDPWLRVYGPDGTLLGSKDPAQGAVAELALTATNSGTYTVLISDGDYTQYQNEGYDGTGTYQLNYVDIPGSFAVTPGDQGGPMTNGAVYTGGISSGDLDAWSFTANAGDSVVVRVGTLTSANYFDPWLRVYGPDGTLLGSDDPGSGTDAWIALTATNSGTYTVLISDGDYTQYQNEGYDGTGTYQLNYVDIPGSFVVSPGDQGGPMVGVTKYYGTITLGDLDPWTFTACQGDLISLQLNTTNVDGYLELYGPNGALLKTAGNSTVSSITYTATNCGNFTVLVSSYYLNGTGTYGLTVNGLEDELKVCPPLISGANLTVNGVGGNSGATFILYSTTNIATPFGLWTPVLTNHFDEFGVFNYTSIYNPTQRQQFFRFLVP